MKYVGINKVYIPTAFGMRYDHSTKELLASLNHLNNLQISEKRLPS